MNKKICTTSTWRMPTKEEDEQEIIEIVRLLVNKKWWQSKSYLIGRLRTCIKRLDIN